MFPNGTNLELVTPARPTDGDADWAADMRVFERGVGETRSCGTGPVAAGKASLGVLSEDSGSLRITVPGGSVLVTITADGRRCADRRCLSPRAASGRDGRATADQQTGTRAKKQMPGICAPCHHGGQMTESSSHTSADLTDEPDFDPDDFGPVTAGSGTASAFRMAPPTTGEQLLSDRASLQRVAGLSTELEDVTEVEYRQLRLERVVLVGVWTEGTVAQAKASMVELAALAETAGSAGSRRSHPAPVHPDAATHRLG